MSVEEMSALIVQAVEFWGSGTSFVDLENEIGELMKGELSIHLPGRPNSVLWTGVSQEFADGLVTAIRSKKIAMHPASLLVYAADGRFPSKLPSAERLEAQDFEKPCWVPVTLSPAKAKT